MYTECPKNGVLTVHYGVEEITVNVRKMLKKFYWTYLLIWRSLKVALNRSIISKYTECPKNGVLTVHYGVEEITVNARKTLKKLYWTYLLIWRSLKVALNRTIILKYLYEIVMTATSNRTYYHKVQNHSLPISNPA
jgi:Mg2+ and Co2+ transporter CorA